jgi:hypothetical protein
MKYAVEMDSGAIRTEFCKDLFKFDEGDTQTQTAW